jgi:hypothetical protein
VTALIRLIIASDRRRGLWGEHPAAPGPTWEVDRIERHDGYLIFRRQGLEVVRCKIAAIEAIEIVKDGDDFAS